MKKYYLLLLLLNVIFTAHAQLYIAPGDSISVLPGTLFTLQEHLINHGKIYNNGVLTLNGIAVQNISGSGSTDNILVNNNIVMLSDGIINDTLQLNTGHIFSLGNFQLSSGSINGDGLLRGSANATLILNTNASTLNFDQSLDTATNALKSLTINNSSTSIENKLYLYDALLPNAGTVTLNGELILRSDSSQTARVAPVTSSFTYGTNGRFVIERFIPGRRAWRLLTAPVTAANNLLISDAWQDGKTRVSNINSIDNPEPGYGTHVTFGLPSTNGYDQGVNGNTSIRYLNNTGWNGVPTATNDGSVANSGVITDQPGYMLFVRGDRGTLLSQATGAVTSPTVLRPKGRINTGSINQPLGAAFVNAGSTFRVVGNPYPSAVNFHEIIANAANSTAGFADAFYLWDPNITGNNGVGGFVGMTYNNIASIAAGKPVYDRSINVSSSINNSGDIQSGAAFVIDYAGAVTTMRLEENNKSIESTNTFFRPVRQLQTNLLAENADGSISINDGALINFDETSSNDIDKADLKKLGNFAENISILNKNALLCIEKRKPITAGDTIFYSLRNLRQKKYRLQVVFNKAGLTQGIAPFLEDNFLKQQTALQLDDTSSYGFKITADTATAAAGRFRIIFKQVNWFILLTAALANNQVQLQWKLTDTAGIISFTVQRSEDGIHFSSLNMNIGGSFTATDNRPMPGKYFYRISCINNKGVVSFSNTAQVLVPANSNNIVVFPNPVTDGKFSLILKDAAAGMYELRLLNMEGKSMLNKSFQHNGGLLQNAVVVPVTCSDGTYHLEVNLPNKEKKILKVLLHQQ